MANENPFQDPLRFERQVPECVIVIFGANGDLTKRKLLPALYRLAFDRRLAAGFAIVGISRTPLSDDAFREKMRASVEQFRTPSWMPTCGRPSRAASTASPATSPTPGCIRLYRAARSAIAWLPLWCWNSAHPPSATRSTWRPRARSRAAAR